MTPDKPPYRRRSPLATGIVLIVLGGVLLALNLGWSLPFAVRDYWPIALIVPGLIAIVIPSRHLNRSGGIWLLATGVYCQISISDFVGLGWFSAWPVFVIAYGLDMVIGGGRDFTCQSDAAQKSEDRVSHEG
jgi:Domain of unknown function (DUF5668)